MRRIAPLILLLASCGTPPSDPSASESASTSGAEQALPEGSYRILLSRPSAVGDSYREHTVHRRSRVRTLTVVGGDAERSLEDMTVDLASRVHVRAVSSMGRPTQLEYAVESAVVRTAETERELVPAGSVLRVTRTPHGADDGTIELVGGRLSEEDVELLDIVISTTYSPAGDDAIFGSETPRRVGDRWAIDAAAAARDLNKIPSIGVRESNMSGETLLASVEDVDGIPCLLIASEIRAVDLEMPEMPEGAVLEQAALVGQMRGAFPLDTSVGRLRDQETLDLQIRLRFPREDGATVVMEMRSTDVEATEITR